MLIRIKLVEVWIQIWKWWIIRPIKTKTKKLRQGLVSRHSSGWKNYHPRELVWCQDNSNFLRHCKIVLTTRIGFRIRFQKKELPIATKNVLKKLNEWDLRPPGSIPKPSVLVHLSKNIGKEVNVRLAAPRLLVQWILEMKTNDVFLQNGSGEMGEGLFGGGPSHSEYNLGKARWQMIFLLLFKSRAPS